MSRQIREIFYEYTPLVEPLSLDEAYLDVTENLKGIPYATQVAREIRARIWQETHLTASAGISFNKFLAKMASDQNKPNGQFVITPEVAPAFVEALPIGKVPWHRPGHSQEDERARHLHRPGPESPVASSFLQERFGKAGTHYYWIARAVDHRPVQPDRIRKSVGAENTFEKDLLGLEEMKAALQPIIDKVWRHCEQTGVRGRTVTLKVKFSDFQQITRSRTLTGYVESQGSGWSTPASTCCRCLFPLDKSVRLLGVSLSALNTDEEPESPQLIAGLVGYGLPGSALGTRAHGGCFFPTMAKSQPKLSRTADAARHIPKQIPVELAVLEKQAPEGDDWLHEIKLDGYRMLARIEDGRARLVTRNDQDWTGPLSRTGRSLRILRPVWNSLRW